MKSENIEKGFVQETVRHILSIVQSNGARRGNESKDLKKRNKMAKDGALTMLALTQVMM